MEIDNEGPAFSNFTPGADTITDSKSLTLSTDVVDGDSGLVSVVFFDEGEECEEADFFKYIDPDLGYKQPRFTTIAAALGADCQDTATDTVTYVDATNDPDSNSAFLAADNVDIDGATLTVTPSAASSITIMNTLEAELIADVGSGTARTFEEDTTYSFSLPDSANDSWSVVRSWVDGATDTTLYE